LSDANVPEAEIIAEMNRSKSEIQRAVKMVEATEAYLNTWLEKPQNFDLLKDTEQAFIQIATRNLGKQDNVAQREVTRQFDFFLIEHRDLLSDSAYTLINTIETNPEAFLTAVAVEFGVTLEAPAPATGPEPTISFDDDVSGGVDYAPLIDLLIAARDDDEGRERTVRTIEEVCDVVAEQGKNRDKAALKFAVKAEKSLTLIDLTTAAPSTYYEINAALERCIERIEKLKHQLQELNEPRG
jgi:hypothetical protein